MRVRRRARVLAGAAGCKLPAIQGTKDPSILAQAVLDLWIPRRRSTSFVIVLISRSTQLRDRLSSGMYILRRTPAGGVTILFKEGLGGLRGGVGGVGGGGAAWPKLGSAKWKG